MFIENIDKVFLNTFEILLFQSNPSTRGSLCTGSSVATSLTEGESVRKHVGILDVRGSQFRVSPVPLLQVRSFAVGQISLKDCGIDPTDPRVDELMAGALETEVEKLMEDAKSECRLIKVLENARGSVNSTGDLDIDLQKQLKYQVLKPEYVLVRLRVEHSGFTTLHNQRFGSRFMDKIVSRVIFVFNVIKK